MSSSRLILHFGLNLASIAIIISLMSHHDLVSGFLYSLTHSWYLLIISYFGVLWERKERSTKKKFPHSWSKAIKITWIKFPFTMISLGLMLLNLVPPFLGYYTYGISTLI